MDEVKLFSPATIANLNCGFDVLGLCLEGIGDEMIFRKTTQKGITISAITGADLPLEVTQNVAGVAAQAIYEAQQPDFGIAIAIHKKIKAGSGIGSSSASASGAVFGVNELLGQPYTREELVAFAMKGEALASGSEHADNVAPGLLGGITLIRGYHPLDIIRMESPSELIVVVLHPHIEVKTAEARAVLAPEISLKSAITQWGNLGGFIAGLYTHDYELIGRSMHDVIVEPMRKHLIPMFDEVKKSAIENGALGAGISGAGPSLFALCRGEAVANTVASAMSTTYRTSGISFDSYLSAINPIGVCLID